MTEVKPHMILTQAVSVVMFILDTDPQISKLESSRQTFGKSPWKFHHVTELNTTKQKSRRVHARQEFYELMPDAPLLSMCTTHFGKKMLRINITTYNHMDMVSFYHNLFGHSPVTIREDFSYFTFTYTKQLSLQLALKNSCKLMPYPTSQVDLILSLSTIPKLPQLQKLSEDLFMVADPDGNAILLSQALVLNETESTNVLSKVILDQQPDVSNSAQLEVLSLGSSKSLYSELASTSSKRPDVIPQQDHLIAPSPQKRSITKTIQTIGNTRRRRSGSPANLSRKLVIHTRSSVNSSPASSDHQSDTEMNNNSPYKRRDSIDIVATF